MKHKPLNKPVSAETAIAATPATEEDTHRLVGQHSHRIGHKEVTLEQISWQDAVKDFLRQSLSTREPKTQTYYRLNLERLARWAEGEGIALADFRVRHLREYIAVRSEQGTGRGSDGRVSDRTLRADAICIRVFFRHCASEKYVPRDPLTDYSVPKAAKAFVKCPSDDEVSRLLKAVPVKWSPAANPVACRMPAKARTFLARRDYAILAGLVETAARIGEMLSLRLEDYDCERMQITFRVTKTDRPRTVPISTDWQETVDAYLRARPKCDSPLLFISRTGQSLSVTSYGSQFRHYADFAGVTGWSLHGLRHYALSQIARVDVLAAQQIAGHTSLVVTQGYLHTGADQVRAAHAKAAPLSRLLVNRRSGVAARKRLV